MKGLQLCNFQLKSQHYFWYSIAINNFSSNIFNEVIAEEVIQNV